jgi:hypothetical protein
VHRIDLRVEDLNLHCFGSLANRKNNRNPFLGYAGRREHDVIKSSSQSYLSSMISIEIEIVDDMEEWEVLVDDLHRHWNCP